ncbi:MAG: TIGR03905 family TSCPD domain-containing protein [Firmicutes bacterium]|nr:TIGR03905 family TSCPD domain-containing protein [Bacillota bacterium]
METYRTKGNTCCKEIIFEIEGEEDIKTAVLLDVRFAGGCSGNLQGIGKLVKGMRLHDIVEKLTGVLCRETTSCPDQLALAIKEFIDRKEQGIVISRRRKSYTI